MKFHITLVLTSILSIIIKKSHAGEISEEEKKFVTDAGCKKWCEWDGQTYWCGGNLLERGVCTLSGYQPHITPEKGGTKVLATILDQNVVAVNAKGGTVSIELTLMMQWTDPKIRTNFSEEDNENGGIGLHTSKADKIWTPDLFIYRLGDYKTYSESKQVKALAILPKNELDPTKVSVVLIMAAKTIIRCHFDLSAYPMDKQMCEFRFGSPSSEVTFVLHAPSQKYHTPKSFKAAEFYMAITFVERDRIYSLDVVGFNITMYRGIQPFILEFYLPCIAIVLVSQISFVIPLTALPGRVALLVTQFLTLTNLFIHAMVKTKQIFEPSK